MLDKKYLLQLFADGASGDGNGAATGSNTSPAPSEAGGSTGDVAQQQGPDRDAEFEQLIKGDYKDAYDARVQKAIDRRFKTAKAAEERAKAAEERLAKIQPLIDRAATKYNLAADNLDGILAASDEDESFYEQAAYDANMSVPEFKAKLQQDREVEALRKFKSEQVEKDRRAKQFDGWMQEANNLRTAKYPDFDFATEVQNPQFFQMISVGVPLEAAYQAIHFGDLVQAERSKVAQETKQAAVSSIRANGLRPVENGLNAQTAVRTSTDLNNLSLKDINSLFERAGRGEKITFR